MAEFGYLLESIDPWWFLFFPILILLIDLVLIGSEISIILALAFFMLAGVKFSNYFGHTDFNGIILTWLIPVFLTIAFLFHRYLLDPFFSSKLPSDTKSIIGQRGLIEEVKVLNESENFFYKESSTIKERDTGTDVSSYRLIQKNGNSFVISNTKGLADGQAAKIIYDDNGIVTVEVLK